MIVAEGAAPRVRESKAAPPKPTGWPQSLPSAKAVGEWYGKTFGDAPGAGAIEAMASMHPGAFVLRDVPVGQIEPNNLMPGDMDQAKVDRYAAQRKGGPPIIAVRGTAKPFSIADGADRLAAAVARGDTTIRAYVPAELADLLPADAGEGTPSTPTAPPKALHRSAAARTEARSDLRAAEKIPRPAQEDPGGDGR